MLEVLSQACQKKCKVKASHTFSGYWLLLILLTTLVLLFGLVTKTYAAQSKSFWTLYIDNDALAGSDRDQAYSGGISISLTGSAVDEFKLSLAPVLTRLDKVFMSRQQSYLQFNAVSAGLTVFTPNTINTDRALVDERPYASLIYYSNNHIQVNALDKTSITSSLTIGLLGLKLTGDLQNLLHSKIAAKRFEGWDNQISNGGEPTFRYSIAQQRIIMSQYRNQYLDYELSDTTKFNLGYLTDILWGISFRVGQLRSAWWSYNPELEEYTEKSLNSDPFDFEAVDELYFWAGINWRLRFYNAFLEGQFRDSAVTYNRSELKSSIIEYWLGVTFQSRDGLGSSYFIRKQSSEINTGLASRDLVWGGIIINQSF